MTDLTIGRFRPMEVIEARLIPMIAAEAIDEGEGVYQNASGQAALSDASAAGTVGTFVGVATSSVPAGRAVDVLYHGRLVGYDLSGMDPGDAVYVSDTAGALSDTAGTVSKIVGHVFVMTDVNATKFIFVDVQL